MVQDKVCRCEGKPRDHICALRSKGLTLKIKQLTNNPNFACSICGEVSNSEANICSPVPLFI